MSIVHADSFDIYGTDVTLLTDGVYASYTAASLVTDPDGVSTQRCLRLDSGSDGDIRYVLQTADNVVGVAGRFYLNILPTDNSNRPYFIKWHNAGNSVIAYLTIDTTGRISAYNGASTLLGTTTGPVVTAEGWWHIEAKLTCGLASNATVVVKVEGVEKLNITGFTTSDADVYQIQMENHDTITGFGPAMYVKDFVVWDGNGSVNNDFVGTQRVINCVPDADDTLTWTPSTGAVGWSILDNNPPVDGTYIAADDTPPAASVFTLTDLPTDISSVKAVLSYVRAAKSDGGDGNLQVSMVSGASDSAGADNPITAGQKYWIDVHELDPNTSTAWTRTSFNASKIKLDRTV
jgi:hypothetical protein